MFENAQRTLQIAPTDKLHTTLTHCVVVTTAEIFQCSILHWYNQAVTRET